MDYYWYHCFFIGKNSGLVNYFNWMLGNGTYLWFLTVLLSNYFLFYYVWDKKYLLFFSIVLNLASLTITSFGYLNSVSENAEITINNYLNIANWIAFFALGILSQSCLVSFVLFLRRNMFVILISFIVLLALSVYIEPISAGYFSKLAVLVEVLGSMAILSISSLRLFNNKIVLNISTYVFTIYLTYFLIFPIKRVLGNTIIFELINPVVILILNYTVLVSGMWLTKKVGLNCMYSLLLGIRQK